MLEIIAECRGLSPILMNPMSADQLEMLRTRTSKPKVTDRSARDEASEKLYTDTDGNIGIPAVCLFSCLTEAGRAVALKGRSNISTATSTKLPSFLSITADFLPFIEMSDWEVDQRQGRNPNGGEAVCLVRPRITKWHFLVPLQLDDTVVPHETALKLLHYAGTAVGLGDFRPACRGPFGRFKVAVWTVNDLDTERDDVVVVDNRARKSDTDVVDNRKNGHVDVPEEELAEAVS